MGDARLGMMTWRHVDFVFQRGTMQASAASAWVPQARTGGGGVPRAWARQAYGGSQRCRHMAAGQRCRCRCTTGSGHRGFGGVGGRRGEGRGVGGEGHRVRVPDCWRHDQERVGPPPPLAPRHGWAAQYSRTAGPPAPPHPPTLPSVPPASSSPLPAATRLPAPSPRQPPPPSLWQPAAASCRPQPHARQVINPRANHQHPPNRLPPANPPSRCGCAPPLPPRSLRSRRPRPGSGTGHSAPASSGITVHVIWCAWQMYRSM